MRHIDADKLLESVTKNDFNDWLDYDIFQHLVEEAPTADVVPKSEVEKLQAEAEELYNRTKGEVLAFCKIQDFIAELKKKYTESKNG